MEANKKLTKRELHAQRKKDYPSYWVATEVMSKGGMRYYNYGSSLKSKDKLGKQIRAAMYRGFFTSVMSLLRLD